MKVLWFILLILTSVYSKAQEVVPELITDRPDQTESSEVVPIKSLQIETGFLMTNDKINNIKHKGITYNTTLLRYGLFQQMELRLGLDYQSDRIPDSTSSISGFSPLYTGFKVKVHEELDWMPAIAFLGAMVLPFTADDNFKPSHAAADMRFSFSHTLSNRFSLGYNLGVEWDGDTAVPAYFYSASLGIGISEKIGAYMESYGLMTEKEEQGHHVDAGITFLLLPNLQFDVSGGIGLSNKGQNFLGVGLSYRIPK